MRQGKRSLGSVYQRGNNGRWVASVRLPTGKRIERSVPANTPDPKAAAELLLAEMLTAESLGTRSPYTLAEWLDEYLERDKRGKAASTGMDRQGLSKGIREGLGRVYLGKLTPAMVQRWADKQTGAHRTRLKRLQLLRAALNQAVVLGHIVTNPAAPIKLERQPQPLVGQAWRESEITAFLAANEGTRLYLLWRLGLLTGARIGELLALRVEDYNPVARTLKFQRTIKRREGTRMRDEVGPPKTPSSLRTFPLSAAAEAVIKEQLAARAADPVPTYQEEGWLFPGKFGGLLAYSVVLAEWKASLDRAPGVRRIRMHDMRDTFISLAMFKGAKQEVVAKLVGHKDSTITMRIYRQVYAEEMEDVRDLLNLF